MQSKAGQRTPDSLFDGQQGVGDPSNFAPCRESKRIKPVPEFNLQSEKALKRTKVASDDESRKVLAQSSAAIAKGRYLPSNATISQLMLLSRPSGATAAAAVPGERSAADRQMALGLGGGDD